MAVFEKALQTNIYLTNLAIYLQGREGNDDETSILSSHHTLPQLLKENEQASTSLIKQKQLIARRSNQP